jgi:hypothetical protein
MEAGYVIERPNRAKASSKSTRAVVVVLLLASVALMLVVIVGGWSALQGGKALQIAYVIGYLGLAYYIGRWNRGALPVAAALAIILGIVAGVAGPDWFARDKSGYARPESLFGSAGLESAFLGLVTFVLIPVQLLLIAFAAQAFRQDWHVELEVPKGDGGTYAGPGRGRGHLPAGA